MKIAVLPGDGIGPEIMTQAMRVLDVLKKEGLPFAHGSKSPRSTGRRFTTGDSMAESGPWACSKHEGSLVSERLHQAKSLPVLAALGRTPPATGLRDRGSAPYVGQPVLPTACNRRIVELPETSGSAPCFGRR